MENDNKQIIIEKIWGDPTPVLGGEWVQRRKAWETQRGAIRLWRNPSGTNITVHYNHGSGMGGQQTDIFTHIQRENALSGFWETLQFCAKRYGIELRLSAELKQRLQRSALARAAAPSLIASLGENTEGEAFRYLTNVRGMAPDGRHFGELTAESVARVKDALQAQGLTASPDDFKALGLTDERARAGYSLVLPYYRNGVVTGFVFRNVRPDATAKYLYSEDLGRGGYCDTLTDGKPAHVVEGQMDALRLMAAGIPNVIAMGGAKMGDEISHLLSVHNIHEIIYIPDTEYNEQGERKTKLVYDAVKAFQSATVDGEQVITHLYVAEIPTPQGVTLSNYKIDADTYGKEQGVDALRNVVGAARGWWDYELDGLDKWVADAMSRGETISHGEFEQRFRDIYSRCTNPIERELIRQNIASADIYKNNGITPAALLDIDRWTRQDKYTNSIKAGAQALSRAVEDGANPAVIADILASMRAAQDTETRDEWDAQVTGTFQDGLDNIKKQPKTIRTKWELGNIAKNKAQLPEYHKYEQIEFPSADITVFCAPTSHGKTMILFQSALDLVQSTDKTFLYVSCEENQRQLLERALNVYLSIPTTEDGVEWMETEKGKRVAQNYCFIKGTRKRALKAYFRADGFYPEGYTAEHWERLSARIADGVTRYGEQVFPRLKFVHTEDTAESIAANVERSVEQLTEQGADVGGVFVDYMQLLTSDNSNAPRNIELKDVCKALKQCASNTNLPVVIAAQLNRYSISEGVDAVTVANIGEGADIERIANNIYLVWQVDKTKRDVYIKIDKKANETKPTEKLKWENFGTRSRRIFTQGDPLSDPPAELKTGYLYVEQMKARDGRSDGWGLFPFDGERGFIGNNDINKMME